MMCRCAVLLFVFLLCVSLSIAQECSSLKPKSVKFGVTSRHNETGHLIGQVKLNHGAKEDRGMWEVDVDHIATECDGDQYISLVATFAVPPQTDANELKHKSQKKRDSSYQLVPGLGYYKVHTTKETWHVAREVCATEGAHLLILNSDAEWTAIKRLWESSIVTSSGDIHIGVTDFAIEGQFVTVLGEHLNMTGYNKWDSGQPNEGTSANCVYVQKDGKLYDQSCNNKDPFICEMELFS